VGNSVKGLTLTLGGRIGGPAGNKVGGKLEGIRRGLGSKNDLHFPLLKLSMTICSCDSGGGHSGGGGASRLKAARNGCEVTCS